MAGEHGASAGSKAEIEAKDHLTPGAASQKRTRKHGLIFTVTKVVMEEVTAWQARLLEALYPVIHLDALHVKNL